MLHPPLRPPLVFKSGVIPNIQYKKHYLIIDVYKPPRRGQRNDTKETSVVGITTLCKVTPIAIEQNGGEPRKNGGQVSTRPDPPIFPMFFQPVRSLIHPAARGRGLFWLLVLPAF